MFTQSDDYEVYYNVIHARNGSSIDPLKDFERKITLGDSVASVKTFEGENENLVDTKNDHKENLGFEEGEMTRVGEEILLCDVRDYSKGWQCGRVLENGEKVCDHHVIELQKHAVRSTKKKPGPRPVRGSMAGARSGKTKKRTSTSPYEFYYYSGFGPSWGKKRGIVSNEPAIVASNDNKVEETSSNNDVTSIRKEEGKRFEPETYDVGPTKMELAYIDDEDDNKKGKTGKKTRRKPKARSLKSLM